MSDFKDILRMAAAWHEELAKTLWAQEERKNTPQKTAFRRANR